MIQLVPWVAAALLVAGLVFVVVLTLRRLAVTRGDRRRREAEARVRPLALALADGEAPDVVPLDEHDAQTLAAMLARYARWLSGSSRVHIAEFFDGRGDVAREIAALRDRRAWRRATAAHALGDMGAPTAVRALLAALADEERDVRAAAARSLGRLAAPQAVEPLVYALADRMIPRAVVGQALLVIGAPALPSLRGLEARAEAEVRAVAVELVGLLGDASDARALTERLRDSSAEVRAKAVRALGRIGASEAAAEVRAALNDRIPFVRANAAHALGMIGDRAAVPTLVVQARSDVFDPAHAAAEALVRLDPNAVEQVGTLASAGPHLREAADLLAARKA